MINCKFILSILNFNFIGVCSAEDSRLVPNYGVYLHNLVVQLASYNWIQTWGQLKCNII